MAALSMKLSKGAMSVVLRTDETVVESRGEIMFPVAITKREENSTGQLKDATPPPPPPIPHSDVEL